MSLGEYEVINTIDISDVLETVSDEDLLDYIEHNFPSSDLEERFRVDEEPVSLSDFHGNEIVEFLVDEYHRGAFSHIDFDKFFEKIGKTS